MLRFAGAVLDADDGLGVELLQRSDHVVRQAHASDLGDVIQVQAQLLALGCAEAVHHVAIAVHDAFIAHALQEERRQHQAAVHAGGDGVLCQREGLG